MKITFLLIILLPTLVFSHGGGLDEQGGHFNRKTNTYECHKKPCFSIHKQTEEAYKKAKGCTVKSGKWYGVYTGPIFTIASDVDIDHIVPLAHAYRHGADKWAKSQRRAFANDSENLLVVDDSTNQSKSDQGPHEWLPPQKSYWCEYGQRWERVKDKYGLRYSSEKRITLSQLSDTCT